MKYGLYLSLGLLISLVIACNSEGAVAQNASAESPDFNIEVNGLTSGGTAFLIGTFAEQRFKVDSTQISNGSMRFQRDEPYPAGFYFVLLPSNEAIQLLLDKDQTFTLKTEAGDLMGAVQVEGNIDNELFYANQVFENQLQPQLTQINQQVRNTPESDPSYAGLKARQQELLGQRKAHLSGIFDQHPTSLFTSFKRSGQNPDIRDIRLPDGSLDQQGQVYWFRTEFWDDVDFSDDRLIRTPVIYNKLNRYMTELTAQNPDSIKKSADFLITKALDYPEYFKFFTNWIALNYEPTKTTLMDAEAVYVHMVQKYFTNELAFWSDSAEVYALQLRAYEMAASLVGLTGPDVQAPDPSGQLRSISELKSPYIVVYMYTPTCEHCMEETPKLLEFYKEWKNKGVDIFGIAVDTNDQEWKDYVAKTGMPWTNVFDPTNKSIYAKYYVNLTPEIYVLNPERKIIAKNLKVSQIAQVIEQDRG